MKQFLSNAKNHPVLVVSGIIFLVVIISVVSIFTKFNGIQKEGVKLEQALTAQYKDNQNELSAFISGFYETLGVADQKSEKINAILTDAVKGRYEEGSSASPANGQMISALVEAYPDLGQNMQSYDKVIDYVVSGREAYKQDQSKLLDMLRAYDTWRESGLIDSKLVSLTGFPSHRLEANTSNIRVSGMDARNRMYDIVLTGDANTAYETGTMDPLLMPSK